MKKTLVSGITFDASAKTVVHADFSDITIKGIFLVTNITDQTIIYNFADSTKGGTLSTDTLTLEYDTTSMDDADDIQVIVDDGVTSIAVTNAGLTELADAIYTEAATDATINGIPVMFESDTGSSQIDVVSNDNPLPVSIYDSGQGPLEVVGGPDIIDGAGAELIAPLLTGGRASTATPSAVSADDDVQMLWLTRNGALNIADAGGSLTVDGTVAVTNSDITSIKTAVEILDNAISGSEMQVDIVGALPAGTAAIGKLAANSGVDIGDVDVTSISAGTNLIGDVGIQPRTSGGLLIANASSQDTFTALTSTAQVIKASAGQLYGWSITNPNTSAVYVHFYNVAAASVTVGTTTPAFPLMIPALSKENFIGPIGIEFTNAGWSWAATTTGGGNTAPTTALEAVAFYK
jgi:hypothetical protein